VIRERAVDGLAAFLSDESNPPLSEIDMEKLWKGIFYCYWMSDKPLVQQALSSELAGLLLKIRVEDSAFAFLKGFLQSMVREWNGIDRLRMDKYYMLVRKYLYASFVMLINLGWKSESCSKYQEIMTERGGPIVQDGKTPTSLLYHLTDIYLEELDKALRATQTALPAPLIQLLQPFIDLLGQTSSNITFTRINDSVLEPILNALSCTSSSDNTSDPTHIKLCLTERDFTSLCTNACTRAISTPESPAEVRISLLKTVFTSASHRDTRDSNRRKLYAIWKSGMLEHEGTRMMVGNDD